MIVSDLEHVQAQIALTPAMLKAFEFLRQSRSEVFIEGRIEIDGEKVFALLQSYETTKNTPEFEYHRKYVDVQYVVEGDEVIGWASQDRLSITVPYQEDRDICLGQASTEEVTLVRLTTGQVMVLYPTDAHAPKLAAGEPAHVKKIVVKVGLKP